MTQVFSPKVQRLSDCPLGYEPSEFFRDYIKAFLPPIYMLFAERISQQYRVDFVKLWAWESSNLMDDVSLREELGDISPYMGWPNKPRPVGTSFQLSEVYRSAFIRTLEWLHWQGRIPDMDFLEHILFTCPVDLSFWEVRAQAPPSWWPRTERFPASWGQEKETTKPPNYEILRGLTGIQPNTFAPAKGRILAIEGPCLWTGNNDFEDLGVRFAIVGFAYRIRGPDIPRAEDICNHVIHGSSWHAYPLSPSPLATLDGRIGETWVPGRTELSFGDLQVVFLASRFEKLASSVWQWYRGADQPWMLSPFLVGPDHEFVHNTNSWSCYSGDQRFSLGFDWRLGPLAMHDEGAFFPHGQVLEVPSDWLDKLLEQHQLRLAYIMEVKMKIRKYPHDKAQDFSSAEFIDLSQVITHP